MAPVRRYLRITKYSVLECRIYLDNPALAQSWLLNPRDPILPRVIESIRPLVLPKLREEKERGKKKSSKKKGIKDVIVQGLSLHTAFVATYPLRGRAEDFEVSMFLTETSTRHSLLTKHKHFREKAPPMMQSNSTRLIGETDLMPVDVEAATPVPSEQDSDDEGPRLADVPLAEPGARRKRPRNGANSVEDAECNDDDDAASAIEIDSDADEPAPKRPRGVPGPDGQDDDEDDKKKLAMDVSYEGFAIYGRVLCLVVKKRQGKAQTAKGDARGAKSAGQGQARMENWISSSQVPVGEEMS